MALKGTRKLIATAIGVAGLVGFNIAMAVFAPAVLSLTTSILTIIGIAGLAGYEIQTQGGIDRSEAELIDIEDGIELPPGYLENTYGLSEEESERPR